MMKNKLEFEETSGNHREVAALKLTQHNPPSMSLCDTTDSFGQLPL